MATYSSNTTIKIQTAVSASAFLSTGGTSSTIYTCPASSYAILNFSGDEGAAGYALVSDNKAVKKDNTSSGSNTFYVGPGQTVKVTCTNGTLVTFYVTGVEFKNSP